MDFNFSRPPNEISSIVEGREYTDSQSHLSKIIKTGIGLWSLIGAYSITRWLPLWSLVPFSLVFDQLIHPGQIQFSQFPFRGHSLLGIPAHALVKHGQSFLELLPVNAHSL